MAGSYRTRLGPSDASRLLRNSRSTSCLLIAAGQHSHQKTPWRPSSVPVALGSDGVELDVRASSDGRVIVHHDSTLDRTTTLRGPVKMRTAGELAAVNVPELRDVLHVPRPPRRHRDQGQRRRFGRPRCGRGAPSEDGRTGLRRRLPARRPQSGARRRAGARHQCGAKRSVSPCIAPGYGGRSRSRPPTAIRSPRWRGARASFPGASSICACGGARRTSLDGRR